MPLFEIHYYHHTVNEAAIVEALASIESKLDTLIEKESTLMATLDQYLADQAAFNANIKTDLDAIQANTTALNQKIADLTTALANGPTLTADQQAKVDGAEAAGQALQAQADAAAGKTPPAPPATT